MRQFREIKLALNMPHCLMNSVKFNNKGNNVDFNNFQFMPIKNDNVRQDPHNEEFNMLFQSNDWSKINDLPIANRWMLDKIPEEKKSVNPKYESPPLSEVSDDEDNKSVPVNKEGVFWNESRLLELESQLLSWPAAECSNSGSDLGNDTHQHLYSYLRKKHSSPNLLKRSNMRFYQRTRNYY